MKQEERLVINLKLSKAETNKVRQYAEKNEISVEAAAKLIIRVNVKFVDPMADEYSLMTTQQTINALLTKSP